MSRPAIALVLYYQGSLKFHPSIMNTAFLLAEAGYAVDIFKPFNADEGELPSERIRVVHGCSYARNPFARIASLHRLIASVRSARPCYEVLFGIDAYGLLTASAASRGAPVVYLSLELLSRAWNDCDVRRKRPLRRLGYYVHHSLLKTIEKRLHRRAALTVIQDETRWRVLRRLNDMPDEAPVAFLPNSPLGDSTPAPRTDYLRRKYGIAPDKCIVIYAGSLGIWTGIDRVVAAAAAWPDAFVLVLHGRGLPDFMAELARSVAASRGRIILSLDQLVEREYEAMLRSADIGLSWYADRNDPNVYFIGAGSGKLFYYMKHGLPVVANRFPGLPEIIEPHGAGICVDDAGQIADALCEIELHHDRFGANARRCFAEYEFGRSFRQVLALMPTQAAAHRDDAAAGRPS